VREALIRVSPVGDVIKKFTFFIDGVSRER